MTALKQRLHADGQAADPPLLGPVPRLVHLAVETDDPACFLTAAERELGRPLGLVSGNGEVLAHAPDDERGRRALLVARAVATASARAAPGWSVVTLTGPGRRRVGFLAIADERGNGGSGSQLAELVATLLGEQLSRRTLVRRQNVAFIRRLLSDPSLDGRRAINEAEAAGVTLAGAYQPAVLVGYGSPALGELAEQIDREARSHVADALTVNLDGHVILLHPASEVALDAATWLERIVEWLHRISPSSTVQAITSEDHVELTALRPQVAQLLRVSELAPRAQADHPVVSVRHYALDELLWEHIDASKAHDFVQDRLGALIDWDREHRTDLLRVLETALDFPRHDQAARRCFMHRNTFRHRLRQATDLLDVDILDPHARLAVHVALKLRRDLETLP